MAADGKKYSSKSVENGESEFRNFCKTLNMIEKERKKRTEILKVLIYDSFCLLYYYFCFLINS